ncbi:MAG: protein kinase, partial [Lachnospiraceae bacterium]|nr:protein kinase [Lachnospiraceae bacterium]
YILAFIKQKMIKNYKIQQRLGIGSYGTVYQVININTNKKFVIKQISLNDLSQEEISNVKLEAKILSSINSKYVVKYYDSFEENNNLNIVMEYCDGGDLGQFIISKKEKNEKINEDLIWLFFIKITLGLAAIHKLKILHRDLKTLNIFLSEKSEVKIGDLGVAKILNNSGCFAKTLIGTPYYLSPELCGEKPYNNKSDIWALGCILYELCTFEHAFRAKSQAGLILKILKENPEPIGNEYSLDLQNLIHKIFDKNMEKRPSCFDILTSEIIINKAKIYGLFGEIEKLYPEYSGFNAIDNNGNNKRAASASRQ